MLTINSQKVQHLDQSLTKPHQLKAISSLALFSWFGAAKCMEIRAAKKKA
jgi:hypothetical protein